MFYGDVFRPAGRLLGVGDPWLRPADATEFDAELLMAWWRGAAESDAGVIGPDARTLASAGAGQCPGRAAGVKRVGVLRRACGAGDAV
jgi:hypothetical protein